MLQVQSFEYYTNKHKDEQTFAIITWLRYQNLCNLITDFFGFESLKKNYILFLKFITG